MKQLFQVIFGSFSKLSVIESVVCRFSVERKLSIDGFEVGVLHIGELIKGLELPAADLTERGDGVAELLSPHFKFNLTDSNRCAAGDMLFILSAIEEGDAKFRCTCLRASFFFFRL